MTNPSRRTFRPFSALRDLLESEIAGGIVLMFVAVLALIVANSPLSGSYFGTLHASVFGLSVLDWINDALMAVFFLVVGLEIKREMVDGQLTSWSRRALPGIGALGGMIVPALIFVVLNSGHPAHLRGWAISSATDIAFSLGAISLLGSRVPISLKVFLAALAILDDLGAVLIIAVFYNSEISFPMLGLSAACVAILIGFNRFGVKSLLPYLGVGLILWVFVFRSGIHATLAGVALALTIPIVKSPGHPDTLASPLHRLAHYLAKPVAFGIVPLFGLANAGVSLAGTSWSSMLDPLPLGVTLGLFLGKQIGVFSLSWLSIKTGIADLPAHASWSQFYGVTILCGIGFTMSLFISLLAFPGMPALQDGTKIGVLLGSLLSGVIGLIVLRLVPAQPLQRS